MTISPPANVKIESLEDYQVLASGIDTLYLALEVIWPNENIFKYLETLKEASKVSEEDVEGIFKTKNGLQELKFNIKPHGSQGFPWILLSNDYALKIGNSLRPQSRPSIMVEIRSEVLWRLGAKKAVDWILDLILGIGASIVSVKPSRVDFCVDIVFPSSLWSEEIKDFAVTRAKYDNCHRDNLILTGISIGKGYILARIYDKAFEISTRPKKSWMFDIWKIDQVPTDKKIIRIEFQLRRTALKELGMNQIKDLFQKENTVWKYLTTKWLKFQDRPGKHTIQRKDLEWWQKVQSGYHGSQNAYPAIRVKAFRNDKNKLIQQMYGFMTSLQAAAMEEISADDNYQVTIEECLRVYIEGLIENGKDVEDLNKEIRKKRARYYRPHVEVCSSKK